MNPPQKSETAQQHQSPNKGVSNLSDNFRVYKDCTASFVVTQNATITAIATGLLTFVTLGLVWIGWDEARSNKARTRAYMFPSSVSLCDGMMLTPPQNWRANEPGVHAEIRNMGQTPASKVVSWAQIAVIEPINEEKLIVPKIPDASAATIGAQGSIQKGVWYGHALTPNEIQDVAVGVKQIYFYGRVEYVDIFERPHHTNFRYRYSGIFPPIPGVIMLFCDKGNDAH